MNKARRLKLAIIKKKLLDLTFEIEKVEDEEQSAFDNLPEAIADSERGDQMTEFVELLNSSRDKIDEAMEEIDEVIETETAINRGIEIETAIA